jgi:hypothetical protein
MASGFFRLWAALLDGKATPEQIAKWSDEQFPDMDEYIGYPVKFNAGVAVKANKNGVFVNQITPDDIEVADKSLKRAIGLLYKNADIQYTQDAQPRRYLRSPKSAFLEEGLSVHSYLTQGLNGANDTAHEDELDESIPF